MIDATTTFEGRVHAGHDLWVQGKVEGEIICRGTLTVDTNAVVNARIEAQDCVIYGNVDGEITCRGRSWLAATAVVTPKLRTGSLMVDAGARIIGSVETNYGGT